MIFTGIAIIIAGMGLFGLGAFTTAKRTKEIGIRKVLGASASRIVLMFSKEYIKWVVLAAVMGFPIGFFAMQRWLQNFAYKIPIRINVFVLTFMTSLIIAFISVGYRSAIAATANPVSTLRDE